MFYTLCYKMYGKMEIGLLEKHSEIIKIGFKIPRKLKKKMKLDLKQRLNLNKQEMILIWKEYRNNHILNLDQTIQRMYF